MKKINFSKQFFFLLALVAMSVNAWGATLTAKVAVGSGKGTARVEVYSRYGGGAQGTATATDANQKTTSMNGITILSWGYSKYSATAADGYTFDAWYTNAACTSGKQTDNPYSTGNASSGRTDEYWAKFTPNNYTLTLNKQSGSGGSGNITVTYEKSTNLTGTIAAPTRAGYTFAGYYSGQNGTGVLIIDAEGNVQSDIFVGDDMYIDENRNWVYVGGLTVYAKWVVNKYTVTFDPNGEGATVGTTSKQVTFDVAYGELPTPTRRFYTFAGWYSAAEGGNPVTATTKVSTPNNHSIYAHWTLAPEHQTISWNEMPLTMSRNSKQAISLISTSGLTDFDVTSSNPEIIAVSGGYLQAGNTNGTAEITAIQPGNMYFYPDTLKTIFTVSTKDVPYFFENGFTAEGVNELKVDSIVTLNLANVSEGLEGDFTIITAKNGNVMGVVREGNTVTIRALHVGQDTITVTQAENDDVYGLTRTYIFNVTRYVPEFLLSKDVLELDETATLTLNHVDDASIAFVPEGKVSYDGSTGTITAVELGTTTLIVSQAETNSIAERTEEITITVTKKTPTLRILVNNEELNSMSVEQGSTVLVEFDRVSDAEMTVTNVSGAQYASYVDGVFTAAAVGTAVFRATLPETDTYFGVTKDFSLTVTPNTNHVPVSGKSYTIGNGSAVDWTHKFETLSFKGVPDKLSFKFAYIYQVQANIGNPTLNYDQLSDLAKTFIGIGNYSDTRKGVGNTHMLYVEQSSDGRHWTTIWTDDDASSMDERSSGEIQLEKDTRYLRFHHSCNFSNSYSNIQISELKYVEEPDPATIDFGSAVINSGEVSKTSLVHWCNIAPLNVTSSNPRFTVTPAQFGNFEQYGSQDLTISYSHTNEAGINEGDITISNGTQTRTIHVKAVTTKRPQTITWNADLANTGFAMNVEEQYPDEMYVPVIATATNSQRITFTSDKPEIVEVVADTALLAKAVGTAKITARQAGDAEYEEVSDTQTFQVTNKRKQSILWDQNLYGLLTTSEPVELTAWATSDGEITYTSHDPNVVTVSGNILTVVGEGETYITATQAGFTDDNEVEWFAVSQNNYVIVRNPASQCKEKALTQNSLTLNGTIRQTEYNLVGIPDTLTFSAKHGTKSSSTWGDAVYSGLIVKQFAKIDGQWKWDEVYNEVVGTDDTPSGNILLDESATKIQISTMETGTNHTISNIQVTRKKLMRANVDAVDLDVESNSVWNQVITVTHSNIDLMTITTKQGLLNLSTTTLGEGCGDYGDDAFTVSFTPAEKNAEYKDTIVITDGKAKPSTIEIPVRLYSKGLNQSITGFELPETAVATDVIPVSATASSELEVSFLSSNAEVAYVEDGYLNILKADTVTITAVQPGNEKYDAAPSVAKFITITKAATSILNAPTVTEITYGQTLAEATLTGGEGSVEGTFAWETPAAVPAAGTQTYTVVFTPAQSGIYATASTLVSVKVAKATPTVTTWPTASDITIAQSVGQSELTGGEASVEGTFVWKNPTESRLPHGTYERAVIFTPTNQSYNTVEGTVSLNVINVLAKITEKPTPVVENPTYGMTLADVTLQGGSANVEGAFSWADTTTPLLAGTHDYEALFTPQDLELYAVVKVAISITSAQAIPSIVTLPTASELTYGTPLSESVLTGGEGSVAGTFQWKEGDKILSRGTHKEAVLFVPENANYATLEDSVSVSILMGIPQITSLSASELTYGQTLEASQLSGEANIEGTFAWAADLATVLTAGDHEVAVRFTSADENYNDVDTFAVVTVAKATPQITMLPIATELESGETLAQSTLSGGVANTEGTFAWADSLVQPEVGTQAFDVVFTPVDTANYTTTTIQVSVTTLTKRVTLVVDQEAPIKMIVGQSLSEISLDDIFYNAYVGETEIDGTIDWEDPTMKPAYGAYNIPIVFTPDNEAYSQAHATVVVHVLNTSDEEDPFTALDNANANTKAQKILRNGQILIIRDGRTYNLQGLLVE